MSKVASAVSTALQLIPVRDTSLGYGDHVLCSASLHDMSTYDGHRSAVPMVHAVAITALLLQRYIFCSQNLR